MAESAPPSPTPLPGNPGAAEAAAGASHAPSLLGSVFAGVRRAGRDMVSVALGRLLDAPEAPHAAPDGRDALETTGTPVELATRRLGMLHAVTEQLRGAADEYLAAKMDEIEARVDQKLDVIEERIDRKIVELHAQLAEMRDRELRHRLRLLKITLIFTVLVAVLSLVYKWVEKLWHLS